MIMVELAPVSRTWYNKEMVNDKTHVVIYQDGTVSEPLAKTEAIRRKKMSHKAEVKTVGEHSKTKDGECL